MTKPTPTPSPFTDPRDAWNKRFSGTGFHFGTDPNEWLRDHAGNWHPGQRVLCVADGEGRNSVWLAARGLEVDAFDIADLGVAKARRLAEARNVRVNLTVADCDSYPWPSARYDGVAAIFVQFADPALRETLFTRIVDSLKPGGILVLQGYTPKQLEYRTGGPPQLAHLYTEAMLREAFAQLDITEMRTYETVVTEGQAHAGMSALIGMVARRPG